LTCFRLTIVVLLLALAVWKTFELNKQHDQSMITLTTALVFLMGVAFNLL
jgi:hypothetical protein